MDPDEQADDKPRRAEAVSQGAVFTANVVVGQRRQIDAHESDQGPEVEQLRPIIVGDQKSSEQRNRTDKNHVVGGNPGLGMDGAKEFLGDRVAASHSVKQAGRAQLRTHAGTHGRNQQRDADGLGEQRAPRDRGHVAEGVLDFGRRKHVLGAEQLRAINFSRRQKPRDHADQNGSQKNISLGIVHFLRQGRNTVETDVGEHRDRGAMEHPLIEKVCGL